MFDSYCNMIHKQNLTYFRNLRSGCSRYAIYPKRYFHRNNKTRIHFFWYFTVDSTHNCCSNQPTMIIIQATLVIISSYQTLLCSEHGVHLHSRKYAGVDIFGNLYYIVTTTTKH